MSEIISEDQVQSPVSPSSDRKSIFDFGVLPFDPLFLWITLIYGVTRILELAFGTEHFWERQWIRFVDFCDMSEHDFTVLAMSFVALTIYWLVTIFFLTLDLTGSFRKHKVQPGKNEPVDTRHLIESIVTVLFNQTVVSITFSSMSFWLSWIILGERNIRVVPSFFTLMVDLLISYQVFDIFFYIFHRIMHTKYLYKNIHKIHHEWKAPIGVMAIYAHPTEHFFTNLIPVILGPVVTVAHPVQVLIWVSLVAITTISDHSGYHLPFLKSPEFHDHHHVAFTECFGTSGVMDFIFKTDVRFRKSINFRRHRVLLSFKSTIRELYPKRQEISKH